ncbi:hypothetical protein [Pseudoalteromonas sp. CAL260-MNA-CIBAN-0059]|uniref:hypothetical protein n=1 Tax=Pseudoalteromonas sp. CAL260-MNA-CIBAN-0059 TaxID=3140430 RepID=UPI0033314AC4
MIDLKEHHSDFIFSLGIVDERIKNSQKESALKHNADLSSAYRKLGDAVTYGEGDPNALLIIYKTLLTQVADLNGLLKPVEVKKEPPVCFKCAKFQMKKMEGGTVHMRCSSFGEILSKPSLAIECNQLIVKDFVT